MGSSDSGGLIRMTTENNEPIGQILIMEVLEAAMNQAISLDPELAERLQVHTGRVIRIKASDPDFSFYLAVCDDGVQLFSEHEGPIDARLRMSSWLFARYVLGASEGLDDHSGEKPKVSGDIELLADLMDIAAEYSLWSMLRRIVRYWLPDFESFEDILRALREHEPAWMSRIEHLPQLVNETLVMLKAQNHAQQAQTDEIVSIRKMLESDRRANQVSTIIGLALIVLAFLTHNGYVELEAATELPLDTMVMLIVAMALLIPRLRGGARWKGRSSKED